MASYLNGKLQSGGSSGGGSGTTNAYTHSQAIASANWPISHDLGTKKLLIQVWDGSDPVDYDSVTFTDNNNLIIHFTVAQSGEAIILG